MAKSNWVVIKQGIRSKPAGTISNINVTKNGVIRIARDSKKKK